MKVALLISCCLWLATNIQAQDFRKDFMAVYQNYATIKWYTQEVKVRSFATKNTTQPTYTQDGKIVKNGANYYSTMGGQHTLIKGKQFLHVNTKDKRMLYYQKEETTNGMEQYASLLDSMKTGDVTYLGASGDTKRYVLQNADQAIIKTELHLDMQHRLLTKIVYYYKEEKQQSALYKTIITYQTNLTNQPSTTWFNLGKYIHVEKGWAVLQPAYQRYRLTQPDDNEAAKRKFSQ